MRKPHIMTGGRYPVLRSVAILSLLCAALAALGAVVAAGWVSTQLGDRSMGQRMLLALPILGGGVLAVIGILVFAEVLELFIDMATSLRMLAQRQARPRAADPLAPPETALSGIDEVSAELAILRGR